ncbi:MAG: ATP-binding protein [Pseudobdellovibrionaceae bacterium]
MYERYLNFESILERKSLFFIGPRLTGKSTLLKNRYPGSVYINLLKQSELQKYLSMPNALEQEIDYLVKDKAGIIVIIIDEVQKAVSLLNEVHHLIEKYKHIRFILSGSSARKLKRSQANLLGGRASWVNLHPLCFAELDQQSKIDWYKIPIQGGLPSIFDSTNPWDDLDDYIGMYLKEEIQAEGLSRSIENFSRFLQFVATVNTEQVNYTSLASDAQLAPSTVREYFQILEDTLIGYSLPAFLQTQKRKAMTTAKFYLFDCGIANALLNRRNLVSNTAEYGKSLEQALFLEIRAYLDYNRIKMKFEFWRSTSKFEVDFLLYNDTKQIIAIEVKSTRNPTSKDFKGLMAFEEEFAIYRKIIVCNVDRPRKTQENIEILPILDFLKLLWSGELLA